ncbi:MAG: aspartate-alanine antiporter [Bacteroidales bacterium]
MNFIGEIFRNYPEFSIFFALAAGFLIGKIRLGTFELGPVLGTLFAGLVIGQFNVLVPGMVKTLFFDFFLFSIGYKVGPQFFAGFKKGVFPQLILTFFVCVVSLLSAFVVSKLAGYNTGIAAGLIAGAFTESTIIGTAAEAIQRLPLSEAAKSDLINNIPIAYAATYLIGTTSVIIFLSEIAPRLIRVNLSKTAADLDQKLGKKQEFETGNPFNFHEWDLRVFQLQNNQFAGKTAFEIEKSFGEARILIEKIKNENGILDVSESSIVQLNDKLLVAARKNVMVENLNVIGIEVVDQELQNIVYKEMNVVITKKNIEGMTLAELATKYGRGVMLKKFLRQGQEIPFNFETQVYRGDLLMVKGIASNLENAAKNIGYLETNNIPTDLVFVALGILLGGLLGMLSVNFKGIEITLTTSGGALLMGLIFGWFRSRRPTFGLIPDPALWLFDNLGLTVFIAIVGIQAGPVLIQGLSQTGISIVFSAVVVALLPHILGVLFGYYILKMNPVILLGVLSGAGTNTAALKAIQVKSASRLPVLGYTIPYALGNILLTVWGPVIVALMN